MPLRPHHFVAAVALVMIAPACGVTASDRASDGTAATTTTERAERTTTTEGRTTATEGRTTTTEDAGRNDAIDAIAANISGDDVPGDGARCFAEEFVNGASKDGADQLRNASSNAADLSSEDVQVFITAADGCIDLSDLTDAAGKGALESIGNELPVIGGEDACISASLASQYDSSGQLLYDIATEDPNVKAAVAQAIGACIQPETLKALIVSRAGADIDPAVAECVAQGFIEQSGGTASAFKAFFDVGNGADPSALQDQFSSLRQICAATGGAGG